MFVKHHLAPGWTRNLEHVISMGPQTREFLCFTFILMWCNIHLGRVKRICVFEHSVMTNFNCACPANQRGQGSGFPSEGSSCLTASMSEQRRFWRDCTDAQARLNLCCLLIQAVSQEEFSDRKPDLWPLWMAGHAQLKFVMTECSKTQIRLHSLCKLYRYQNIQFCSWDDNHSIKTKILLSALIVIT